MRQLLAVAAVGLAAVAVLAGPTEVRAASTPGVWPACEGVRVPAGFRVFLDPDEVVAGRVVEVRSGRVRFVPRADGVWVGTVPPALDGSRDVHVVVKSDAARFSQRRWSSWIRCRTVVP